MSVRRVAPGCAARPSPVSVSGCCVASVPASPDIWLPCCLLLLPSFLLATRLLSCHARRILFFLCHASRHCIRHLSALASRAGSVWLSWSRFILLSHVALPSSAQFLLCHPVSHYSLASAGYCYLFSSLTLASSEAERSQKSPSGRGHWADNQFKNFNNDETEWMPKWPAVICFPE